jgi:hypothetical protein
MSGNVPKQEVTTKTQAYSKSHFAKHVQIRISITECYNQIKCSYDDLTEVEAEIKQVIATVLKDKEDYTIYF